jgi:hypothetical protein
MNSAEVFSAGGLWISPGSFSCPQPAAAVERANRTGWPPSGPRARKTQSPSVRSALGAQQSPPRRSHCVAAELSDPSLAPVVVKLELIVRALARD